MRTPVRRRHSLASAHGQGAAPDSARRRLEQVRARQRGRLEHAREHRGHAGEHRDPVPGDRSSVSSGEKRSCSTTVTPASSGASSAPLRPNEWASGSAASTRSSGASAITGPAQDSLATASAAWERTAPLGCPVLPEV